MKLCAPKPARTQSPRTITIINMKPFIFIFILFFLVKSLPAQIVTDKAPYNIALTRYLDFLSYTKTDGKSDTILTEVESLNGKNYGKYYFKKVNDSYYYAYLNYKTVKYYYFIDYRIIDIEENKITVCFQMGQFICEKSGFFKKPKVHGSIPFDRGYNQMYFYSFDCEKKQWFFAGEIK
jgi:hypothetical protein